MKEKTMRKYYRMSINMGEYAIFVETGSKNLGRPLPNMMSVPENSLVATSEDIWGLAVEGDAIQAAGRFEAIHSDRNGKPYVKVQKESGGADGEKQTSAAKETRLPLARYIAQASTTCRLYYCSRKEKNIICYAVCDEDGGMLV